MAAPAETAAGAFAPAAAASLLSLQQVSRRYGAVAALEHLDLELEPGHHLLLAGPNGAGKTTLLRLAAGLARPQAGQVRVAGADPRRQAAVRQHIGLLSHQPLVYDDLTCAENLAFFARLYGLEPDPGRIAAALKRVGLADRGQRPAGALSRGLKQRLALARATLHQPRLLLLDEPFTGLDREAAAELTAFLRRRAGDGDTASILVTHRVAEVAGLVNQVLVLDRGRRRGHWPWGGADGAALAAACQDALAREATP